jgi:hypothetical protein
MLVKSKVETLRSEGNSLAILGEAEEAVLGRLAAAFDPLATDIVFVSGSRMEGLGNSTSDFDLYVVQSEKYTGDPFVTVVLDAQYAVYEIFSLAHATRVATTLNAIDRNDYRQIASLSLFELEFYYRVLIGRALTSHHSFEQLRDSFRRSTIDECVATWCGLRSVVLLGEARQKLALCREAGAYVAAQQAAAAALDSFLAAHGQSYPGFKWRFEKLLRIVPKTSPDFKRAWDIKSLGRRDVSQYLDAVAEFCRDMGMQAFESWSLNDVMCRQAKTAQAIVVNGQCFIVENKTTLFELDEASSKLWQWIATPTRRGDLLDRAEQEQVMTALEVDEVLFDLAMHGLLRQGSV